MTNMFCSTRMRLIEMQQPPSLNTLPKSICVPLFHSSIQLLVMFAFFEILCYIKALIGKSLDFGYTEATPAGMVELPFEIWVGTPSGRLVIVDKQSQTVLHSIPIGSVEKSPASSRRQSLLLIDKCVWFPFGSEIHVILFLYFYLCFL